ncbi:hypothetical protein [Vibrio sp. HN007]|uniref:hypothetical protein n=1 Tax=Vibrio iocasae TaxID=3098914 RepID=UPI0035D3FC6B
MKTVHLILILSALANWPALARTTSLSLPWLEPMMSEDFRDFDVSSLNQMEGLFDCGIEEGKEYCSEPTRYYTTLVDSYVWVENEQVTKVELHAPFSPANYSELQLSLRKDDYVLSKVTIGDTTIDVKQELQSKPVYKVDREVMKFMNKGSITKPRKLILVPKSQFERPESDRYAEFISSDKEIIIRFYQLM